MNLDEKRISDLDRFQEALNLKFNDFSTLNQAFVHPSYSNERGGDIEDNQRLEFLGDSVLELIVSHYLFSNLPESSEGQMSRIRALTVCETSLAKVSRNISLGSLIYLGKGEECTGGRDKSSILADTFEALVGAIYMDKGLKEAGGFIESILGETLKNAVNGDLIKDFKTSLQENLQRLSPEPIVYKVVDEAGPDHDKTFIVQVVWKEKVLGSGEGKSKKQAEQRAAEMALGKPEFQNQI